jgi:SOS response regulatory protein OraA/RecX
VQILAVKPVRSDKTLCTVRLEPGRDGLCYRVPVADAAAHGWTFGRQLSEAECRVLAESHQFVLARAAAVRWLNRTALTRAVVEKKCAAKGFSAGNVKRLLADLERLGLLNDAALAANFAEAGLRRRPVGEALIAERLVRRGVAADIAEQATRQAAQTDGRSEVERAVELAERTAGKQNRLLQRPRTARPPAVLDRTLRRRVAGALARAGFDEVVAAEALERVLGPEPEGEGEGDVEGGGDGGIGADE